MNLLPYNSEATTLAAIPIAQNNRIGGVDGELKCFQKGREEAWGASACMQRHPHEIRIITICAPISAPRKGRLYNVRRPCKTERSTIELIHDLLKPWWHWTEHSEIFSMRTVHLHICILIISDDFSFGLIVRTVQERNLVPAVLSLAVVSSLVTGVLLPVWPAPPPACSSTSSSLLWPSAPRRRLDPTVTKEEPLPITLITSSPK